MTDKNPSKTARIIKTVAALLILVAVIFGPAGTFKWPEAWIFLILYILFTTAAVIWMKKNDPELLNERMSNKKDVKKWDKYILLAYTFVILVLFVTAGLDAVRFRWSHVPLVVKIIGFLGFFPAAILVFRVMTVNTYLSEKVRIQEERGHKVCTTGPYRYVRHPMYVGVIIFSICLPLALGSFYSLIPGLIVVVLFMVRTSLEDKTLKNELPGYEEYAKKVRYKLIPGVW